VLIAVSGAEEKTVCMQSRLFCWSALRIAKVLNPYVVEQRGGTNELPYLNSERDRS
jgi:hypothetical protein